MWIGQLNFLSISHDQYRSLLVVYGLYSLKWFRQSLSRSCEICKNIQKFKHLIWQWYYLPSLNPKKLTNCGFVPMFHVFTSYIKRIYILHIMVNVIQLIGKGLLHIILICMMCLNLCSSTVGLDWYLTESSTFAYKHILNVSSMKILVIPI